MTSVNLDRPIRTAWPTFDDLAAAPHLPLRGIKVLDLSTLLPGPAATRSLADMGAEVLKVERAGDGDPLRMLMPDSFQAVNRNKRSISLDLKTHEAQEVVQQLAVQADVVIEGFRPGVTERLGCSAQTLLRLNPRLVYCSISGYGQNSLRRNEPGHDINYLAIAGALAPQLRQGEPSAVLPAVDMLAAAQATTAICAALLYVKSGGNGTHIDVSMTDCAVAAVSHLINEQMHSESHEDRRHPAYGVFTAADGRRIAIGCTENQFFQRLCCELSLDDLLTVEFQDYQSRRRSWKVIEDRIANIIATRDGAHWLQTLTSAGLPVTPVHTLDSVRTDPDLTARGVIVTEGDAVQVPFPALFDGHRPRCRSAAPTLGEANE